MPFSFGLRATAAMLCIFCSLAQAQLQYPSKPIRFITPFTGGVVDNATRALASGLQGVLGQPVTVESRTGASGTIAANAVKNAEPDGYTLLSATTNLLSFPASVLPGRTYDPVGDFAPVALLSESPLLITVNANSPAKVLRDLVERAKANPGKLNFGSYGVATTSHFCTEELKRRAGVDMLHVPYRGAPTVDLIAGRLDVVCDVIPAVREHVKAGTLRVLAVAAAERTKFIPDAQTASEQGYSGLSVASWSAVVAPKGTPETVVQRLNEAIVKVLQTPEFQARADAMAFSTRISTPQQVAAFIKAESERWDRLVTEAKIKLD